MKEIGPVLFERSRRARRINLSVRPFRGVRVSVPVRGSFRKAVDFAAANTGWILRQLQRIKKVESEHSALLKSLPEVDRQKARLILTARLKQLAEQNGFKYNRVSFRNQKTRWGSCSHNNNISLNMKLIRLPSELLDYVLLHELVHTRVKNHSRSFWSELDKYTGCGKALATKLRKYGGYLL